MSQRLRIAEIKDIEPNNLERAVNNLKPPIFGKKKTILFIKLGNGVKIKLNTL